jgi:hypothetical protein
VDSTFQSGLAPNERIQRSVLQPDGRLVSAVNGVSGYDFPITPRRLIRFEPDGALDPTFLVTLESPGFAFSSAVFSMELQPDGRIQVGGTFLRVNGVPRAKIVRLDPDGLPDWSFDSGTGLQPVSPDDYVFVNALAALASGGWLVGGDFGGYDGFNQRHLVKLLPETSTRPGTFRLTFDENGYPWWPVDLWIWADEPVRFFRARPAQCMFKAAIQRARQRPRKRRHFWCPSCRRRTQ